VVGVGSGVMFVSEVNEMRLSPASLAFGSCMCLAIFQVNRLLSPLMRSPEWNALGASPVTLSLSLRSFFICLFLFVSFSLFLRKEKIGRHLLWLKILDNYLVRQNAIMIQGKS
jgi:hypothetical protein